MARREGLCAVLLAALVLGGCGGGEKDKASEPPTEEAGGESAAQTAAPKACQIEQMRAELGEEGTQALVNQWIAESSSADDPNATLGEAVEDTEQAPTLPEFLAERGYDC